jgi:NADH-quinone oxidoreductase subunit C
MNSRVGELGEAFARLLARDGGHSQPVPAVPEPTSPGRAEAEAEVAPCRLTDYGLKGYHLDVGVASGEVVAAAELLDREGFALDAITGVDWLAEGQMEVVYDYFHPHEGLRVVVRARIPRDQPDIATICRVFPGANWHEREAHDFFGIRFLGHPDLTPLLLPEDATYHPLRKDFVAA